MINWKRLVIGGLVAGVAVDVAEGGLSGLVVGEQFQREVAALGVTMQMTPSAGLFFVSWGFIVGFVLVWLYAIARPRLGPGPKTAAYIAVAVWIVHGLLPHLRDAFLGIFSMSLSVKFAAFTLAWHLAAALAGAALYREAESDTVYPSDP